MTIKIKELKLKKDVVKERVYFTDNNTKTVKANLIGNLSIEVKDGIINAKQDLDINKISEELKSELYKVLNKIEDELNGFKKDNSDKNSSSIGCPQVNLKFSSDLDELHIFLGEVNVGHIKSLNYDNFAQSFIKQLKNKVK